MNVIIVQEHIDSGFINSILNATQQLFPEPTPLHGSTAPEKYFIFVTGIIIYWEKWSFPDKVTFKLVGRWFKKKTPYVLTVTLVHWKFLKVSRPDTETRPIYCSINHTYNTFCKAK